MEFVAEKWSETIVCGKNDRHEVVFKMTPWNGVELVFNPCDAIPAIIGSVREMRCNSDVLLAIRNRSMQSIWFGGTVKDQFGYSTLLRSKILELFKRRQAIARQILSSPQPDDKSSGGESSHLQLTWAKLTNASGLATGTEHFDEISSLLRSKNVMMQLHALDALLQLTKTTTTPLAYREAWNCMLQAFKHNSLPSFFRERMATRLADAGTTEVLATLIEKTAQDSQLQDCLPQVESCIKQMSKQQGKRYAVQSLLEVLSTTHERLGVSNKLWFSLLRNLPQATTYELVAFAKDQSPAVRAAVALLVSTEQIAYRDRLELLRAIDDFPVMVPQLVDCVLSQLHEAAPDERESRKFVRAALRSNVKTVKHAAAVILFSNFLRKDEERENETELTCDAT